MTAEGLLELLDPISTMAATEAQILKVHDRFHHDFVKEQSAREIPLDADTYVNRFSYTAAVMAAGCVVSAVDAIVDGRICAAFCGVRPPGHHAESRRSMGFCLFNNIAVGARHAQQKGLDRIFIFDWDVHHGNGTQEIFYTDPSVFYASVHEFPLYPGSGRATELGHGEGDGYNLNVPLPAGSTDADYRDVVEKKIVPAMEKFKPDLIMISAGFDAHERDPLANMRVTSQGFGVLTETIRQAAGQLCGGRIVSVLEGGYDLEGLSQSVVAHCIALDHA